MAFAAKDEAFLHAKNVPRILLAANLALAIFYFIVITFFFERGNLVLFWLLIAGEAFHVWQAATFIVTVWEVGYKAPRDDSFAPPVDVFIPVAGEPADIIEATVRGAQRMDYPNFKIFILNDGYVAKKPNWQEVETLAERLGVNYITRRVPGGAKAGNINHAFLLTSSPFIAFFDADHVPEPEFLKETIPYFKDRLLGFVQTPQYYKNNSKNFLAGGAWEQQALFFGPICRGKNRFNAVTMCGTNMVIRRTALEEVDGMDESSIAEDFITGYKMHERGWKSLYVPKILARGLAPEDFLGYYKQQARWARGSLDLLFRENLLFSPRLTAAQRIQYLSSVSYFLSGWVVLIDAIIPLAFFYLGIFPIHTSTMMLAMVFIPYMLMMLYVIQRSSNSSFSYRALAFSVSSFPIHITASLSSLLRIRSSFSITPKRAQAGNFLSMVWLQIFYVPLVVFGAAYALVAAGWIITPAWIANVDWGIINAAVFIAFIKAAAPQGEHGEPSARDEFVPSNAPPALAYEKSPETGAATRPISENR